MYINKKNASSKKEKEKEKSFEIDISEKPLEQPSILQKSPEIKNVSNSNQNSASNIVQMSINSNGDKIINISNEDINISEFQQIPIGGANDIIIPSDNENEGEELNEENINSSTNIKNKNNKNIVQTTTTTTQKIILKGDDLNEEELHKKIYESISDQALDNKGNNNQNINIIKKTIEGPTKTTIITTTISSDGTKTVTKNEKIEGNNIETHLLNLEDKDKGKDEKKMNNFLSLNYSTNKKVHKMSENEENTPQNILYGSNIKYDFDCSHSHDEDEEKDSLNNKFELIKKTPTKPENENEQDSNINILTKEEDAFNISKILFKLQNENNDNNKTELKQSIQTFGSIKFGVADEENSNYTPLSSQFSFGFKNNSQQSNLKDSQNIVSFGVDNSNQQTYQPLTDKNIKFGVSDDNNKIDNEKEEEDTSSKNVVLVEKSEILPVLDDVVRIGNVEVNQTKQEENKSNDNMEIDKMDSSDEENGNENNVNANANDIDNDKKDKDKDKDKETNVIVLEKEKEPESLFKNISDKSTIFGGNIFNSNKEQDSTKTDGEKYKSIFEGEFTNDNKELNLNLNMNSSGEITFQDNEISKSIKNISNTYKSSLFGSEDLFGNKEMKKGSVPLINNTNSITLIKEEKVIKEENSDKKEDDKNNEKNNDNTITINSLSTKDNSNKVFFSFNSQGETKDGNNNQKVSAFTSYINQNEGNCFLKEVNDKKDNKKNNKNITKANNNNPFEIIFQKEDNKKDNNEIINENTKTNTNTNKNPFDDLFKKDNKE